ncbi:MAG: LytTR family DNA-binding domain-containing protein [Pyrinomonadaceae bacterium]|nr:LytTR family DNA-binding domain-containing protein [Pyrinomonadaceae bacterium]
MSEAKQNYRVIVVDDEPLARLNLCALIKKDDELEIIKECENGYEAISAIETLAPDIVFLDVQMPEINGFQVLEQVDLSKIPALIFVTAYDQYAIKAFEFSALDYLLKPVEESRFQKAVGQAKFFLQQRDLSSLSQRLISLLENNKTPPKTQPIFLERIVIKSIGKVLFLPVSEIEWIEADDYYVKIHTAEQSHLLRESMNELEKSLDPNQFQRIHRSIIVNLSLIKQIQTDFQNKSVVILQNGKKLKMSRPRQELIERMSVRKTIKSDKTFE